MQRNLKELWPWEIMSLGILCRFLKQSHINTPGWEQGPVHKVKSITLSLKFSSSQLARISLAEFVSKLILI